MTCSSTGDELQSIIKILFFETENAISTLQFSCLVYLSPLYLRYSFALNPFQVRSYDWEKMGFA